MQNQLLLLGKMIISISKAFRWLFLLLEFIFLQFTLSLHKICEQFLQDTECSESLISLIRVTYEFSERIPYLGYVVVVVVHGGLTICNNLNSLQRPKETRKNSD